MTIEIFQGPYCDSGEMQNKYHLTIREKEYCLCVKEQKEYYKDVLRRFEAMANCLDFGSDVITYKRCQNAAPRVVRARTKNEV